jgi:hypothetical protein
MAARNALLERDDHVDFRSLPRVIFTTPPVAASGLTEQQAADQGIVRECRVLPMSAVPRALVNRDPGGRLRDPVSADDGQIANAWSPYLTFAEGVPARCAGLHPRRQQAQLLCCLTRAAMAHATSVGHLRWPGASRPNGSLPTATESVDGPKGGGGGADSGGTRVLRPEPCRDHLVLLKPSGRRPLPTTGCWRRLAGAPMRIRGSRPGSPVATPGD